MRRALAAVAGAAVAVVTAAHAQTPPPQRFEARAEAVLVDVTVLDGDGRQVADLTAGDFRVDVEGQARPLQSASYVTARAAAPPSSSDAAERAREAMTSSNSGHGTGRLLLIAVDESRLSAGANRAVLRAAESLLERVSPSDLVGFTRIPTGTGGVEFTTNREAVRAALRGVTGSPARQPVSTRIYLSEAHQFTNGNQEGWAAVLQRACPPASDRLYEACVALAEGDARSIVTDQEARTSATLRFLDGLATRLQPLNTAVNLVLISEGMFLAPESRGEMQRLAARAAAARISLHVVRPDRQQYDIQDGSSAPDARQDERLLRDGLEQLAASHRGALFTATGGGNGIFDRINTELSGYYLLAFEPTDDDRSGRSRRIRVTVNRRGVTVRARASFTYVRRDAAVPATVTEQLQQALASPLQAPGVPIRVATYPTTGGTAGNVRVIIGAEIGAAAAAAARLPVGVTVLDARGRVVVNTIGETDLRPSLDATPSPKLYLTSVVLPEGDYTLRLGAAADGQLGVVHHPFTARLTPAAGGLHFSEMIVTGPGDARPTPSAVIDGDRLVVMLEGQHDTPSALEALQVTFEVAERGGERPALSGAARSEARANGTERAFASSIRLDGLRPGEYVLRARVSAPGRPAAVFERPFRYVPAARPAAGSPAGPPAAAAPAAPIVRPAPPAAARFMVPTLRFAVDEVLRPDVVNPFLDGLQASHRPSDAVRQVVEQAKRGTFVQRTASGSGGDEVLLSFVGGLAALRQGQLPQAMTLFQRTLRGAPDFIGIAFFLGATHAAAGRDREAAGAWQMSLLSKEAEPAHGLLVDALLRVGDGQRALDALQRGPDGWKSAAPAREREAYAEAMTGRYAAALPKLKALVEARPNDMDLLFVAIQSLYRQHLAEPLSGADVRLFDEWTKRYQDAAGASRPSVAPWRNAVVP